MWNELSLNLIFVKFWEQLIDDNYKLIPITKILIIDNLDYLRFSNGTLYDDLLIDMMITF